MSEHEARVVVALPVPRVFSYAVPAELAGRLAPGQRVRVPFRKRSRTGVVVEVVPAGASELEAVEAALDPVPALTPPGLALSRWAADETVSAWGEAVARALPPGTRSGAPPALPPESAPRPLGPVALVSGRDRDRLVMETVARVLGEDGGVLVLAPEIEVARGWAARLGQRLGVPAALVTSAETPRRRWAAWWGCRQGTVRLAVGTRVAAFLPVTPLALTVVLDEEDPGHKAPDAPRWHGRELALRRAAVEGGECLLASAAPSLESWVRAGSGVAGAAAAADPSGAAGWLAVHRVDLRQAPATHALTPALRDAVGATLAAGRSVLLLLNRLGYGRVLSCADCGAVPRCPACRLALTYHRDARTLACRLCGAGHPARSLCGRCRGRRLVPLGWGTERVEAEVEAAFPGVPVARYDGTLAAEAQAAAREAFRAGRARILVGTQMALRLLAETPVGLAALILADTTLNLPDFRAAERTYQLAWTLAEGVEPEGQLWLQSFYPDHPALEAIAAGAREPFYRREWAERRELGYPPARRMASLLAEGRDAVPIVEDLAARCRAVGLTVLGPATLAGGRTQVVLTGEPDLPRALAEALGPLRGRRRLASVRLTVDVDPVELP